MNSIIILDGRQDWLWSGSWDEAQKEDEAQRDKLKTHMAKQPGLRRLEGFQPRLGIGRICERWSIEMSGSSDPCLFVSAPTNRVAWREGAACSVRR